MKNNSPIILVVEDIAWIRATMKRALESYGYSVEEAADDLEAISIAELVLPDLILTEEELPTFDALTAHVREHPSLGHVQVAIINPDEEEGAHHGTAIVLADYDQIESLLAEPSKTLFDE